jgi:hypothetical protein
MVNDVIEQTVPSNMVSFFYRDKTLFFFNVRIKKKKSVEFQIFYCNTLTRLRLSLLCRGQSVVQLYSNWFIIDNIKKKVIHTKKSSLHKFFYIKRKMLVSLINKTKRHNSFITLQNIKKKENKEKTWSFII